MPGTLRGGWASSIVVGSITGIALTSDWLPERVASHFSIGGVANGFVSRPVYVALVIAIVVLLPALAAFALRVSVRRFPHLVSLPHRDYWLAPERRVETAEFLAARAEWLAAGGGMFTLGLHLLVIRANHAAPPHFEPAPLLMLTAAFAAGVAAWLAALGRHFKRERNVL